MFMRVSSVLVALALMVIMAGCSDAPVSQIESGKAALESARMAEAEQYAPALFKEASDSLNAATVEVENQNSKFALFRDYDRATEILTKAQQIAEQAVTEAATQKEQVRLQDSALVVEITTLIDETRAALAKAPRGKGSRADLQVMSADVDAAAGAMTAAVDEYNAGKYLAARQKLEAVKAQVGTVKSQIEAAVATMGKK